MSPPPSSFESALAEKLRLEAECETFSRAMQRFPRGPVGLTPDHVKESHEFQQAKQSFDASFRRLRDFNVLFLKKFKKEYRAYMSEKRLRGVAFIL
jgi:hypothetical protein